MNVLWSSLKLWPSTIYGFFMFITLILCNKFSAVSVCRDMVACIISFLCVCVYLDEKLWTLVGCIMSLSCDVYQVFPLHDAQLFSFDVALPLSKLLLLVKEWCKGWTARHTSTLKHGFKSLSGPTILHTQCMRTPPHSAPPPHTHTPCVRWL